MNEKEEVTIGMSWKGVVNIALIGLQQGTPQGQKMAKRELFEMAEKMDRLREVLPELRKLIPIAKELLVQADAALEKGNMSKALDAGIHVTDIMKFREVLDKLTELGEGQPKTEEETPK